jgi:hypothetical protein
MDLTRTSPITGITSTIFIEGLTQEMLNRWKEGEMIQSALAGIPQELREFVMTGISPAEWTKMFPSEE